MTRGASQRGLNLRLLRAQPFYTLQINNRVPKSPPTSVRSFVCLVLHGILGSPLPRGTIVPSLVRLEELRNIRHQGIIRIGVRQERTNAQQDLANGESWTPLVLEDVQANATVGVDVAMVNACRKVDLGRLYWSK